MTEPIVYRHAVEAFLARVVHPRRVFSFEELRAMRLDPARDTPIDEYVKLIRETAKRGYPELAEPDALEAIGRGFIQGYITGIVGRGIFIVMKLLGPKRGLLRMAENYRTSDNNTEVVATALGPRHVRLAFNHSYGIPEFQKGLLDEVMNVLDEKRHEVTFTPGEGDSGTFEIKW